MYPLNITIIFFFSLIERLSKILFLISLEAQVILSTTLTVLFSIYLVAIFFNK